MKYYFIEISLPSLEIGAEPEISFEAFLSLLAVNLREKDKQQVVKLRQLIDLLNIKNLLSGQALDLRGNLSEKELDQALLVKDGFPPYVFDFLGRWENNNAKLQNFSGLLSTFFKEEIIKAEGFLKRYFAFERQWRLVALAIRANQLGIDLGVALQFEDPRDPFVMQILLQKDTGRYEPPWEYAELKEILVSAFKDAGALHKAFIEWKFSRVEEMGGEPFSIDALLSFMVRLMLVEDWQALDKKKGKEVLKTCIDV